MFYNWRILRRMWRKSHIKTDRQGRVGYAQDPHPGCDMPRVGRILRPQISPNDPSVQDPHQASQPEGPGLALRRGAHKTSSFKDKPGIWGSWGAVGNWVSTLIGPTHKFSPSEFQCRDSSLKSTCEGSYVKQIQWLYRGHVLKGLESVGAFSGDHGGATYRGLFHFALLPHRQPQVGGCQIWHSPWNCY